MGGLNQKTIMEALGQVIDLELGIDIVTLGLIYDIRICDDQRVEVDMTLTTPACPLAGVMVEQATWAVEQVVGAGKVTVHLVFDPPWTPDRLDSSIRNHPGQST